MLDILDTIKSWAKAEIPFTVGTVVDTWRSAPRLPGAAMAIRQDLQFAGSVSGGCVEGSVIKASQEVLSTGHAQLLRFGVSNDEAWSVGLSCGGAIKVYLEPFIGTTQEEIWTSLFTDIDHDRSCCLIRQMSENPEYHFIREGDTGSKLPEGVQQAIQQGFLTGNSAFVKDGDLSYFVQVFPKKDHLVIIGAAHISADLVQLAQQQGFRITVIDPRGLFTESLKNLCEPESLVRAWPETALEEIVLDHSVYVVMLTHDPKIDDQALHQLLRSPVKYIGALGSRKTHQKRVQRLMEAGYTDEEIARIHAPIGLNIGSSNPSQIALSIMAEVIQVKNQTVTEIIS